MRTELIGELTCTLAVALVGFAASLDQVVGLVPERARATWASTASRHASPNLVGAEDGGWVVALEEPSFAPLHPPDEDAVDAVRNWAQSHADCRPEGEHELVLGLPALARLLCDQSATVQVGDVGEGLDTGTFLAAYGESALVWARVVAVTAAVQLRAVVAPVGCHWRVIGVLPPGPTGG